MKLTLPSIEHFEEMMTWFSNEATLKQWSGPNFRYPYNLETFQQDLKLESLSSYSLINEQQELVAFGQYYLRHGKCHLGRLVVAPEQRGKGFIRMLMRRLVELGKKDLKVDSSSLFVMVDNDSAIQAYQKDGFVIAEYPETIPIENCIYMVK